MMSLHQGLGAEADGDADHARAGDQRPDLDADGRQHHQRRYDQQHDQQDVLENRQQGAKPRLPPRVFAVDQAGVLRLGDLAVDQGTGQVPAEIGQQQDHHSVQHATQQAGRGAVRRGEFAQIDVPGMGQQQRRADDERRPEAPFQGHRDQAGGFAGRPRGQGGAQDVVDRALGDADRERKPDRYQRHPKDRHGIARPQEPEQNQIKRYQP